MSKVPLFLDDSVAVDEIVRVMAMSSPVSATNDMLKAALRAKAAGACRVLRGRMGRSGLYRVEAMPRNQQAETEEQLEGWYSSDRSGIGVVTGAVSGNLEMFEFEATRSTVVG